MYFYVSRGHFPTQTQIQSCTWRHIYKDIYSFIGYSEQFGNLNTQKYRGMEVHHGYLSLVG